MDFFRFVHETEWGAELDWEAVGWKIKLAFKDSNVCTIDEFSEGAASLRRYGITFADNIDVLYNCLWICQASKSGAIISLVFKPKKGRNLLMLQFFEIQVIVSAGQTIIWDKSRAI